MPKGSRCTCPMPVFHPASFCRFFYHLNLFTLWTVIVRSFQKRLPGLAAEITYHLLLSLFPALLTFLVAIGLFENLRATFQTLLTELGALVPQQVAWLIGDFIQEVTRTRSGELFSASVLLSLWAASSGIQSSMYALDQIHGIPPDRRRPFWKAKLIALWLTIATMLFLIMAIGIVFATELTVQLAAKHSGEMSSGLLRLWQWLNLPVAMVIVTGAIAFLYRFGPSRWSVGMPLFPGAILAAILWVLLSSGFRFYVANFSQYNRVYGAVGGFIVLQIWLYLSALVLLIGSQLNLTVGEAMSRDLRFASKK